MLVTVKITSVAHKQNFTQIRYIKNRNLFDYVIEEARVQMYSDIDLGTQNLP